MALMRGAREAPGRQERPFGQPARHQGGTREAGKNHLDSLRGTREAGKDQLASLRGTREAGKNHLDSLGGTREAGKDQLDSLRGTREAGKTIWTGWEAPGRQERINWTAWRHQGGTREAEKSHLDSPGGTREAPGLAGLPIESRFGKGAGFCLTFNTISMANGPVRGKSWGGAPRPAAQRGLNSF